MTVNLISRELGYALRVRFHELPRLFIILRSFFLRYGTIQKGRIYVSVGIISRVCRWESYFGFDFDSDRKMYECFAYALFCFISEIFNIFLGDRNISEDPKGTKRSYLY